VNGKVSVGHIAAGYLGLFLVGAATCAIGTFASTITDSQLVAVVVAGFISLTLVLSWLLAEITPAPYDSIVAYLAIFDEHFGTTFRRGRIVTDDFVYYGSIIFVFLVMSVRWVSARRWQ
jgi:ABC-2 type transport system permease protein